MKLKIHNKPHTLINDNNKNQEKKSPVPLHDPNCICLLRQTLLLDFESTLLNDLPTTI